MKLLVTVLVFWSSDAFSAEIARGKVLEVTNTIGNEKVIGVRLKGGGVGPCAHTWMSIKASNFGTNIDSYKQAFALLTIALVADKKVYIHSYVGDYCDSATFVGLLNN